MEIFNRNHVLIIEDDDHIRRFISINLKDNGFLVSEAANGEQALQGYESNRPAVIVLDIMLPDASGFDICQKIRQKDTDVIIIMVTARGQDVDKIKGLEIGADDYVVKPFNPLELVARIKAILRRSNKDKQLPPTVLKSGAVVIDLTANQVFKDNHRVELTPKEFQLVKTFLEHPNKALSRNELMNLVWGEDFIGDPKTIDVHVRKLREKLEDDDSNPRYMETVWGIGYRWRKED